MTANTDQPMRVGELGGRTASQMLVGGVALVLGAIMIPVTGVLHAEEGLDAASHARATMDALWLPVHGAGIVSTLLLGVGFLLLLAVLFNHGQRQTAIVGGVLVLIWTFVRVVSSLIDGFVAPILAERYFAASGAERVALGTILEGNLVLVITLSTGVFVLLGGALILAGVAIYRTSMFHPLLGGTGVLFGAVYLIGLPSGVFGFYLVTNALYTGFSVLVLIWVIALGTLMVRTSQLRGPTSNPTQEPTGE